VDGLDASHRRERVIVVNPLLLDEAMRDEPHLVLDHLHNLILLELEHPLLSDRAVASWQVNDLPHTVVLDGVHLLLHQVKLGVDVALHTT
jgi:hypothetical protein